MLHETLRIPWEIFRELDLALENILVDGHWVVIREWINADKHLVDQDAEAPPVDWLAVAFL